MAEPLRYTANRARHQGVVIVITLLAIILIASLLFYVFNTGTSVQGRVVTQHAADAAAIGGASQAARSMNTVAMNNVETARLIAAVNLLDGIPLAVDLSITDSTEAELGEIDALAQAVSDQVRAGVIDKWFDRKLREVIDRNNPDSVYAEQEAMRELDELFRSDRDLIPNMTWYRAPSGEMGRIHQAMRALDAHSRAVMNMYDEAAQAAAARSAEINMGDVDADEGGLLLPAAPSIPWERGVFTDYERSVKYGLLPGRDVRLVPQNDYGLGQIDDELTNRGPWDAVFGWRDLYPGRRSSMYGINNPPLTPPPRGRITHYKPFGPIDMLLRSFPDRQYSRLRHHIWELQSYKSNYLWADTPIRVVSDADWEIDIDYDNERSTDRNSKCDQDYDRTEINEAMYLVVEIKSRLSDEDGNPGRQGLTWNYIKRPHTPSPFVLYSKGVKDPNEGCPLYISPRLITGKPTWRKVQDHIWRLSAVYKTDPEDADHGGDPSIGLPPKRIGTDGDGNPVYEAQEVHWEIDIMFVGVNVGEEIEVINPWVGFDRNAEDAPAPIDLIHDQLPPNDPDARKRYLTFLGVARQSNSPKFWPSRFQGDKPDPYNTAIAQAHVFNNHSWDLWTQTWQAQLEPVDDERFGDWVRLADDAVNIAGNSPDLDPAFVSQIADHLRSIESLAPELLNH